MRVRFIAAACIFTSLLLAQSESKSPRQLDKTAADYTDEARVAELEGTVCIASIVGEDGHPRDIRVTQGLGLGLDEKAVNSVEQEQFGVDSLGLPLRIEVRYHLSSKYSRWHLIHAGFQPPEGAARPEILKASYPTGAGIFTGAAVEEGRLLGAMGRQGTAAIAFTIDERGIPRGFRIENASADVWGQEAVALLSEWRFKPGTRDGYEVPVPAEFELAWGPRDLSPERIAQLLSALGPASPVAPVVGPKPIPLEILYKVQPEYSQEAWDAKLEGSVVVSLVTREDGTAGDLRVVQGLGKGLDEMALEALRQWRFKPVFVNGTFLPSEVTLKVDFKLK